MSFLSKLFSGGAGSIVKELGDVADKFITTSAEKAELRAKFEEILQKRDSEIEQTYRAELSAQKDIIVAELQQDDKYTKRARPTVVYAGLLLAFWNYALAPVIGYAGLDVPAEFWAMWGGVVGVYAWRRTDEKRRAPGAS